MEVYPNLYISSFYDSFDDIVMSKVGTILNVASDLNIKFRPNHKYLHCGILDDNLEEDIISILPKCMKFINSNIDNGVLIHCLEGKSRSVCVALCYLSIYKNVNIHNFLCEFNDKIDIFPLYLKQSKKYISDNIKN